MFPIRSVPLARGQPIRHRHSHRLFPRHLKLQNEEEATYLLDGALLGFFKKGFFLVHLDPQLVPGLRGRVVLVGGVRVLPGVDVSPPDHQEGVGQLDDCRV